MPDAAHQSAIKTHARDLKPAAATTEGRPGELVIADEIALVRHLQRTIGNHAVTQLIQQQGAIQRAVARLQRQAVAGDVLKSDRFKNNARLQAAYHNSPPLARGEKGEAVAILQQALIDSGYPMPVTTANGTKPPDGVYGRETHDTVLTYQGEQKLSKRDGIAGHQTLGTLDRLGGPSPKPVPPVPATEPSVADLRAKGAGPFQGLVGSGILDADAALLLNEMASTPALSWASDTANFALGELTSGKLAGLVKASDYAKIASRVPAGSRAQLASDAKLCVAENDGAVTGADSAADIGWIILLDTLIPPTGSPRFPVLVLAHELNHHRVRKAAKAMREDPSLTPDNKYEFVDSKLAKKHQAGLAEVKTLFCEEIVARHAAWHVAQQYDKEIARSQPIERFMPKRGRLWAAVFGFAKDSPGAYRDNGYMKELAQSGDNIVGEQVALWMRDAASLEFDGVSVTSDAIRRWWLIEIVDAMAHDLTPWEPPDGLA